MKKIVSVLLSLTLLLGIGPMTALAAEPETKTIAVYSTSDMHGKCAGQNPINGRDVTNSYLKVATAMAAERKALGAKNTILIDNGDTIQGTPITSYNVNIEGGKENPMALVLRYCGYDVFVPGNHEFNYDSTVQTIFYDMLAAKNGKVGSPVTPLCANYIDVKTQKSTMEPYRIFTYTVGSKTFKVGVLGFENVNVPNWDLPSHYEGHDFVHADNKDRSYAYEWTHYWQKQLKETEKCDIVVISAHSGEGDKDVLDPQQQLGNFIANTTGIDLVIGGHDHFADAKVLTNRDGKSVAFVNGGSSTLTKTAITLKADGTFTVGAGENMDLTKLKNDDGLAKIMAPYYEKAVTFVTEKIGTLSGDWDKVTDYHTTQGDTYDLVQRAQIWASGADVSITTPVFQKDFALSQLIATGKTTGDISLKDCYSFYKYDNNLLYMIQMTGKQMKDWLEHSAATYSVKDGKVVGGGFGTDIAYGIDYEIFAGNPVGSRVQNVMYQGKPLADDQILKVALSSYRLSANATADEYGWYATTGITMGTDKVLWDASTSDKFGAVGGSVTLVIAEYIKSLTAQGKEITPMADTKWAVYPTANVAQDPITRLDFITLLHTAAGGETVKTAAPFTDVTGNAALNWAYDQKIASGNGANQFLPDQQLTREQLMIFLLHYATAQGKGPTGSWAVRLTYGDAAELHDWAFSAAMWNTIRGSVAPDAAGNILPLGTVTAAQAQAAIATATAL